jgi:predicted component of type VI protein secretion system
LLSHTLQPEGAYFPLREGRNTFGSQAAHENPALRSEPSLSPNHFSVIVRQSKVRVVDEGTESGTVVDGHTIKSDGMMVNHGSTINAGKHQFEVLLSAALTRAFSPHA